MATFEKFDPHRFPGKPDGGLAGLATLARGQGPSESVGKDSQTSGEDAARGKGTTSENGTPAKVAKAAKVGAAWDEQGPQAGGSGFDLNGGTIVAVKFINTVIGDIWVIADADVLVEHPGIIRARLPTFFFDEVQKLRGKSIEELQAIAMVKAEFPTSRVLQ